VPFYGSFEYTFYVSLVISTCQLSRSGADVFWDEGSLYAVVSSSVHGRRGYISFQTGNRQLWLNSSNYEGGRIGFLRVLFGIGNKA
jgi:hypothetical protein